MADATAPSIELSETNITQLGGDTAAQAAAEAERVRSDNNSAVVATGPGGNLESSAQLEQIAAAETDRTLSNGLLKEMNGDAEGNGHAEMANGHSKEVTAEGANGHALEAAKQASEQHPNEEADEITFPDGGLWAWISVGTMFCVHFFVVGISTSVGIFTDYFTAEATFPGAANTVLSFAATLTTTGMDLYGPITSQLAERYGFRLVAGIGAGLLCAGGIINSFAVYSWTLFVGALVIGLGYSSLLAPGLGIPAHYFRKRLSLAFGLGMSGAGIGGAIIIPATQALLDNLGWRWAYRTIAIISGVFCFIAAMLMKTRLPKRAKSDPIVDKTLLRHKTYWLLCMTTFFFPPVYLTPFLYIPQQIQDLGDKAHGISGALCLSLLNLFTAIGQVITGFAMKGVGVYNLMFLASALNIILFVPIYLLSVGTTGGGLLAFCILAGLIGSPFPVCVADIAADCFGQDGFATKISMVFMFFAPGILITGPILGSIADANSVFSETGARLSTNWTWVIVYCACTQCVVTAAATILRYKKAGFNPLVRV